MKLSIFTTMTNPEARGDHYKESLDCYQNLADEVIVINGGDPITLSGDKLTFYDNPWEKEFHWKKISEAFQKGYDCSTGDWVIHADLDFLFHERDFALIREMLENLSDEPALSFWKYQFILPDRYIIKSRLAIAVHKRKFGNSIKFDGGGESDLCQPSLDGKYLNPRYLREARIPFYNYEKMTKTKEQVMDDCGRMDRAYYRQFGEYQLSKDGSDEQAFEGYMDMLIGRLKKPQEELDISIHPRFIQDTIRNLTSDQMGYSLFGYEENRYVQSR